jgi:hypothetical protein
VLDIAYWFYSLSLSLCRWWGKSLGMRGTIPDSIGWLTALTYDSGLL